MRHDSLTTSPPSPQPRGPTSQPDNPAAPTCALYTLAAGAAGMSDSNTARCSTSPPAVPVVATTSTVPVHATPLTFTDVAPSSEAEATTSPSNGEHSSGSKRPAAMRRTHSVMGRATAFVRERSATADAGKVGGSASPISRLLTNLSTPVRVGATHVTSDGDPAPSSGASRRPSRGGSSSSSEGGSGAALLLALALASTLTFTRTRPLAPYSPPTRPHPLPPAHTPQSPYTPFHPPLPHPLALTLTAPVFIRPSLCRRDQRCPGSRAGPAEVMPQGGGGGAPCPHRCGDLLLPLPLPGGRCAPQR